MNSFYKFIYIVYSLHILCYLCHACVMHYTHTSDLLVRGVIPVLYATCISVMFLKEENNFRHMKRLINVLHTCIFFVQFTVTAT